MGIYAIGEHKDYGGVVWKTELYDTTYTGTTYAMRMVGECLVRTYEGITDKPLFTPTYNSYFTAYISVSERSEDAPIAAILADLPTGKEDQFYVVVYRDGVKWFAGMVITDECIYNDKARYTFELKFTDGLNRLEYYDFPIDDANAIAVDGYISELDAIRLSLQICGIERFYTDIQNYIAVALDWHEINQAKIKCSLVETRINTASFIDDEQEERPKSALTVIKDILQTYGASIRMEAGMWRITHLETQTGVTIPYEYYGKLGNLLFSGTEDNDTAIGSGGNITQDEMVNMYFPSLYGVGETVTAKSDISWGIETAVSSGTSVSKTIVPINSSQYDYKFILSGYFKSNYILSTYRLHFGIKCGSWSYKVIAAGQFAWTPTTGLFDKWHDYEVSGGLTVTIDLGFVIPAPPVAAGNNPIVITTYLTNITYGTTPQWYSYKHDLTELLSGDKNEIELSYVANNTIYNAASVFNEEKLVYCDFPTSSMVVNAKLIYTGSVWQNSEEWESGTTATSGVTFAELLCKKAVYFQRYPRLKIQGTFRLPDYQSIRTIVWRSIRFMFLNGTHNTDSCTWTGEWLEILEQSADIAVGSRNPYRGLFEQERDKTKDNQRIIESVGNEVKDLKDQVTALTKVVNDLKQKSDWGPENFLIQNVDGVEEMTSGQKQPLVLVATDDGLKLKYDTPE